MSLAPTPRAPRMNRATVIVALYSALGVAAIGWGSGAATATSTCSASATWSLARASAPSSGCCSAWRWCSCRGLAVHSIEWARVLHREFHAVVHELSSKEIFLLARRRRRSARSCSSAAPCCRRSGCVPSSALFALMHVRAQWRFLPWTIMSFIMGLAMGLMYMKTRRSGRADRGALHDQPAQPRATSRRPSCAREARRRASPRLLFARCDARRRRRAERRRQAARRLLEPVRLDARGAAGRDGARDGAPPVGDG